jgi:UDPglucose 6-dehydrogenase
MTTLMREDGYVGPLNVGIIGFGVVGKALHTYLSENSDAQLILFDPDQGLMGNYEALDCAFLCVPVPTLADGSQDLSILKEYMSMKRSKVIPMFCRSTVLPGTCDALGMISFPEFLRERSADADMRALPIVCGGERPNAIKIIMELFKGKETNFLTNVECELVKYFHNTYASIKVALANLMYAECKNANANYEDVLFAASKMGLLSTKHMKVPGIDGKLGFGGKCLPKDLAAFAEFTDTDFLRQIFLWNQRIRQSVD